MNTKLQKLIFILFSLAVIGCSSLTSGDADYPRSPEDERRARHGKLGGEGGLKLFGGGDDNNYSGANVGIGVNSYLWRATLDTLSFMPLASTDPFGGVIITDWYEDEKTSGERFKVNVVILDKDLNSNALKVSVFKQKYNKSRNSWVDTTASDKLVRDMEFKILTRARELRVEKESK